MRKLMWFSIGFCAACFLCVYWIPAALRLLVGLLTLTVGVGLFLLREKRWNKAAALVCTGLTLGAVWYAIYDSVWLTPARAVDGQELQITLTAEDFSYHTDYGIAVDAALPLSGRTYHARVYVNQREPLNPGDRITGTFRLRYTAPGALEDATYHSGNGILFLAYPKGAHMVDPIQQKTVRYVPAYLRAYLTELLDTVFEAQTAPFTRALLLGDTSGLDYQTETSLSISGLRHVVAVSGLHISILFSVVYLVSGKRRVLSSLVGFPVLVLFTAMAGFSPSILRAGIMQALMLLALLLNREYDPPTALAFAVLAMLFWNPLMITSVGFQLSAASVAGIFLFSGRIQAWLLSKNRLGRWHGKSPRGRMVSRFVSSVSISLGALLTTTPLTAWYFGTVSLIGIITNLLCLWIVTILFCGIILTCILSALWLPLGKGLAWLLSWLVRYILLVADTAAELPLAAVYTESVYIVAWLVLCYLLLSVFLFSKRKQPVLLLCCAALSLCAALMASWLEPQLDDYRVTVLDVGQGQCVLLQSQGKTYMVDCGGSYDEDTADIAAQTLLSQGVTQLDGLILSHYDKDHVGAAAYLLQRVGTEVLVLPHSEDMDKLDISTLEPNAERIIRTDKDMQICWGHAKITVFSSAVGQSGNESSLCVLFHTEKCDILITGDRSKTGEAFLLRRVSLPQLDALVVGHHGAASSTSEMLLEATRPEFALISVGKGNAYGHPSQSVLDLLAKYGCAVRRTDLEGTIIFRE